MKYAAIAFLVILLVVAVPNLHQAVSRSRQKRTMADMAFAAERFEKGQGLGALRDGWGHPLRVRVAGSHYSMRAAARDGLFETGPPEGRVDSDDYDRDIVFVDGTFRQVPEGV